METVNIVLLLPLLILISHTVYTANLNLRFSTYLSFPVHANDSSCGFVGCRHKNGLSADSVHVDAGARLQVVQMNVTVFSDEKYDILFGADLCDEKYEFT